MAVLFPEPESPVTIIIFPCFNYPHNSWNQMRNRANTDAARLKLIILTCYYRVDLVSVRSSHQSLSKSAVFE